MTKTSTKPSFSSLTIGVCIVLLMFLVQPMPARVFVIGPSARSDVADLCDLRSNWLAEHKNTYFQRRADLMRFAFIANGWLVVPESSQFHGD